MRIAVCYDNGKVFQHFGRTETFKVYEVEEGQILRTGLMDTNGTGHEALAQLLADNGIQAVICGGMGEGAQNALAEAGVAVFSGAEGDADEAVAALLNGELENAGATCDHHESGGGCGGSCGSCGGCHHVPAFEGKNVGRTMRVHYRGTLNDGTQFDASYDRGEPLQFTCGAGQMILGFDKAVANLEVGDEVDVHLMPEEAYGMSDPAAIFTIEVARLPGSEELEVGQQVYLYDQSGRPIPVKVVAREGETITFDANHEMAGKELNFHIEVVEII